MAKHTTTTTVRGERRDKYPYDTLAEANVAAREMSERLPHDTFGAYQCPVCDFFHVGRQRPVERNPPKGLGEPDPEDEEFERLDPVVELELGARAALAQMRENTGHPNARHGEILKRCGAAEARSAGHPPPGRKYPATISRRHGFEFVWKQRMGGDGWTGTGPVSRAHGRRRGWFEWYGPPLHEPPMDSFAGL